jgi:hypothetical protein
MLKWQPESFYDENNGKLASFVVQVENGFPVLIDGVLCECLEQVHSRVLTGYNTIATVFTDAGPLDLDKDQCLELLKLHRKK